MATTAMADNGDSLTKALKYTQYGWPVFPIHSVESTEKGPRCSCGKGFDCIRKGKHPRTKNGLSDASTDEKQVKQWWGKWPGANVGIRTGKIATGKHLFVIDIDPDRGGDLSYADIDKESGPAPETLTVHTGGGGTHLYFVSSTPAQNTVNALADGIDTRGEGGYVVAPPSKHASGGSYEWEMGAGTKIAELPKWLKPKKKRAAKDDDAGADTFIVLGGRNDHLASLAGVLVGKGCPKKVVLASLLAENSERCRPPLDEAEVKAVAKSITRYPPNPVYDGLRWGEEKPPYWDLLKVDAKGRIKKSPGNASIFLCNKQEWKGVLQYDDFGDRINWLKDAPEGGGPGRPRKGDTFEEHHMGYVGHWLARYAGPDFSKDGIANAIVVTARENTIHPVRSYLKGLVWDGKKRVDTWLKTYFGCDDKEDYTSSVGRWWLISAVARILKPGCQADHVLVLEGLQGLGKSTCARILAGEWYLGSLPDLRGKDSGWALQGNWIVEVGELDAFRGVGGSRVKDYISQVVDTYRPAYARLFVRRPRQCVFLATTNEYNYLEDSTGARRFWPVRCGKLRREPFLKVRDQIWAEARALFEAGEQWWPTDEMQPILAEEQEERHRQDPWEEKLAPALNTKTFISALDLLVDNLGFEPSRIEMRSYRRVGEIMRRLGYVSVRSREKVRGYIKPNSPTRPDGKAWSRDTIVDADEEWT